MNLLIPSVQNNQFLAYFHMNVAASFNPSPANRNVLLDSQAPPPSQHQLHAGGTLPCEGRASHCQTTAGPEYLRLRAFFSAYLGENQTQI